MRTFRELLELLTDSEHMYCCLQYLGLDPIKAVDILLSSHFNELSLDEFVALSEVRKNFSIVDMQEQITAYLSDRI